MPAPSDEPPLVTRRTERFESSSSRVITRFFGPWGSGRTRRIVERVLSLPQRDVRALLDEVLEGFGGRHRNIDAIFAHNCERLVNRLKSQLRPDDRLLSRLSERARHGLSRERVLLLGAYATSEYSVESAAFFNPSIVPHPDQSDVPEGGLRFILAFRALGEGHISSVAFRVGLIDRSGNIRLDATSRFVETPEVVKDPLYDKRLFRLKLRELGFENSTSETVFSSLPDRFSFNQLLEQIQSVWGVSGEVHHETTRTMTWLANSNYQLRFPADRPISECVIFPVSPNERNGIEDARFVRFLDDDGKATYYATYTAFNGVTFMPQIIETEDFRSFRMLTLNGAVARNKGMALFPRKINGLFMMVTRHDGENLYISKSEHVHFWYEAELLQVPVEPWELVQIGNGGSPIETEAGWLLLTHGVGPVRRYHIGALLLDLQNPLRVIGRLREPLLSPTEVEREGYVPNVVYSCGAMAYNGQLILPYAMSDTASGIATVRLDRLLDRLIADGP